MEEILKRYYLETDPVKRKNMLAKLLEQEGASQENQVREELFKVRYALASQLGKEIPADGFLGLWMTLEYNKDAGGGLFGMDVRRAQKEIRKKLSALKIQEMLEKGEVYERLEREELKHMVRTYMKLCQTDHSYNSTMFGLMKISSESSEGKLKEDIRNIALVLPERLKMEEELAPITQACREVYEEFFPYEGGLV